MPPDGNCLFHAVALNLVKRAITEEDHSIQSILRELGLTICEFSNITRLAEVLRMAVVAEWTGQNSEYY